MISSTGNQKIKEVVQLQKKSRARRETGLFIAEGLRMAREVPLDRLEKLYVTEAFYQKHYIEMPEISDRLIEFVTPDVFSHMSDTKTPQGVLAVVRQINCREEDIPAREIRGQSPHILILEDVQDPGNLGTMFRTAEAAGVTGILMSRDCVDIYNPKVVRSTMGAVFRMPFAFAEDLTKTIRSIKQREIRVYAAHLEGKRVYDEEDYRRGTAFLIGNEGNGLRPETAKCADAWIKIPMAGKAESLNAAVAAAVLMFEAGRQRRQVQVK
jgi:TrmH family RNA methyltransferase